MRQHATFQHLETQLSGRTREEAAGPGAAPLPSGWICLRDCNLTGNLSQPVQIPFVLLHPEVGVALLDLAGASPGVPDAEAILRRRLEAARFESIFPGYLPIVHLRIRPGDIEAIDTLLGEAFTAQPPLSVPGGDAWVSVLRRALAPRDPSRAAAYSTVARGAPPPAAPAAWPGASAVPPERPAMPRMVRRQAPPPPIPEETAGEDPSGEEPIPPQAPPQRPRRLALPLGVVALAAAGAGALALILLPPAPDPVAAPEAAAPAAAAAGVPEGRPVAVPPPMPRPPEAAAIMPARRPEALPPAITATLPSPAATAAATGLPLPPPPMPPPEAATGAPAAPQPATAEAGAPEQVVVRSGANLRTGPGTANAVLRIAPRGERFHVFGRAPGGWVQVGGTAPQGWIHDSLLAEPRP